MATSYSNKINQLTSYSCNNATNIAWLDIRNLNNSECVKDEFINICQQHHRDKRWILMIAPQDKDIAYLNKSDQVNHGKILRVNSQKVKLTNIESTLAKGNCSAVVLCNADFGQQQLSLFNACAKQGNTQCIVLTNSTTLH
mgnify:CR=1 FL=1